MRYLRLLYIFLGPGGFRGGDDRQAYRGNDKITEAGPGSQPVNYRGGGGFGRGGGGGAGAGGADAGGAPPSTQE